MINEMEKSENLDSANPEIGEYTNVQRKTGLGKRILGAGMGSLIVLMFPTILFLGNYEAKRIEREVYKTSDKAWHKAVESGYGVKVSGFDRYGSWERRLADTDNNRIYDLEEVDFYKKGSKERYKQINIPMSELEKWTCLEIKKLENEK